MHNFNVKNRFRKPIRHWRELFFICNWLQIGNRLQVVEVCVHFSQCWDSIWYTLMQALHMLSPSL